MIVDPAEYRLRLQELREETKLADVYRVYKGTVLLETFEKEQVRIENLEVRDDDVWVTSFPKSGTTWAQEMVWLIANNFDYKGAKKSLEKRYSFLESTALAGAYIKTTGMNLPIPDAIKSYNKRTSRRFVKTHLPWQLLPAQIRDGTRKPKIIHVIRNPKDVCVSYFHHTKIFPDLYISMEEYFNQFITDKFMYAPYWTSVLSYWSKRDLPNVLIIRYEDMVRDLESVINRVAKFLGTTVPEEEMRRLLEHLSFGQMKNNKAVNLEVVTDLLRRYGLMKEKYSLMRKGKVGSYKADLSEDMIGLMNAWTEANSTGSGLKFDC